jgi:carboxypeptidase PM20D1
MSRTTFVPSVITGGIFEHSLAPTADAIVDIRVSVEDKIEEIEKMLDYLFEDLGIRTEVTDSLEPSALSSTSAVCYDRLEKTLCAVFGDPIIAPAVFSGSTSSRSYELFADNIYRVTPFVLTTAEAETMHGKNERIAITALGRAVAFYRLLIESIAGERA